MEQFKKICKKFFFPHWAWNLLLAPCAAAALIFVFRNGYEESWIAYPVYVLSFYALTVLCIRLIPSVIRILRERREKQRSQQDWQREHHFRVSLYRSLIINFAFGIFHIVSGVLSDSIWMMSNGGYYMVLTLIRSVLVIYEQKLEKMDVPEKRLRLGWRGFQICGFLMMLLNIAMTVMAVQMILREQGKQYHEIVVIAMAAYTFYRLTIAVIRVVQYRKNLSPILGAARNVDLTAAMMSLFSLQIAMFGSFGGEFESQLLMNILTGGAVCLLAVAGAVGMIFHGSRKKKEILGESQHGK